MMAIQSVIGLVPVLRGWRLAVGARHSVSAGVRVRRHLLALLAWLARFRHAMQADVVPMDFRLRVAAVRPGGLAVYRKSRHLRGSPRGRFIPSLGNLLNLKGGLAEIRSATSANPQINFHNHISLKFAV